MNTIIDKIKTDKKCIYCGNDIFKVIYKNTGDWVNEKYCSKTCYNKQRRDKTKKTCIYCGIIYYTKRKTKYCSRKCHFDARNKKITRICPICKNKFIVKRCHNNTRATCSRKCSSELFKTSLCGENNPNWRGGISNISGRYSRIRTKRIKGDGLKKSEWEEIKKKYSHMCLACGRSEPEIKLTIDHIRSIKDGGLNEKKNIQPLCKSCNSSKNIKSMKIIITPKEQQIQKTIIDYLRHMKWYVIKINNVGIYNKKTDRYIKAQTKGISDLIAISRAGEVLFIEVKTPTGRLSEHQEKFKSEITERGGHYLVARSWEDVSHYIVSML